jgi:predicted RNA binding protein YcfA (HicA-like mRNA interferase family)
MKLPRDIGGEELAKLLSKYGYEITRQTGSHLRLTTNLKGEHHLTIPKHKPLKVGTLSGILAEVSAYLEITRESLIRELFQKK